MKSLHQPEVLMILLNLYLILVSHICHSPTAEAILGPDFHHCESGHDLNIGCKVDAKGCQSLGMQWLYKNRSFLFQEQKICIRFWHEIKPKIYNLYKINLIHGIWSRMYSYHWLHTPNKNTFLCFPRMDVSRKFSQNQNKKSKLITFVSMKISSSVVLVSTSNRTFCVKHAEVSTSITIGRWTDVNADRPIATDILWSLILIHCKWILTTSIYNSLIYLSFTN